MPVKHWIYEVASSVLARTRSYFLEEFSIEVNEAEQDNPKNETLNIHGLTAVVGVGGPVSLLIAFSFEQGLIDELYTQMTAGLTISPDEEQIFKESVAGDVINTIIGNCTADLKNGNKAISLTPPMIIDHVKKIHRTNNVVFITKNMMTEFGVIDVNILGPSNFFDSNLNYVK
ncbi:MAG: chemotaxis protein CheX [Pseudomonadales bacterium]|nr:chemotaxis protein CheX [Pseudomonadales bacterium]